MESEGGFGGTKIRKNPFVLKKSRKLFRMSEIPLEQEQLKREIFRFLRRSNNINDGFYNCFLAKISVVQDSVPHRLTSKTNKKRCITSKKRCTCHFLSFSPATCGYTSIKSAQNMDQLAAIMDLQFARQRQAIFCSALTVRCIEYLLS